MRTVYNVDISNLSLLTTQKKEVSKMWGNESWSVSLAELCKSLLDAKLETSGRLNMIQSIAEIYAEMLKSLQQAWEQTVARETEQVFVKCELDYIQRELRSYPELARFAEFFFKKGYLFGRQYAVELKPMADKYNI